MHQGGYLQKIVDAFILWYRENDCGHRTSNEVQSGRSPGVPHVKWHSPEGPIGCETQCHVKYNDWPLIGAIARIGHLTSSLILTDLKKGRLVAHWRYNNKG